MYVDYKYTTNTIQPGLPKLIILYYLRTYNFGANPSLHPSVRPSASQEYDNVLHKLLLRFFRNVHSFFIQPVSKAALPFRTSPFGGLPVSLQNTHPQVD